MLPALADLYSMTVAELVSDLFDGGDPPAMTHGDASESPKGTTEFLSIKVRLKPPEPTRPARIPSRIAPAPTRELAYASV
jgi:hypothetical protein